MENLDNTSENTAKSITFNNTEYYGSKNGYSSGENNGTPNMNNNVGNNGTPNMNYSGGNNGTPNMNNNVGNNGTPNMNYNGGNNGTPNMYSNGSTSNDTEVYSVMQWVGTLLLMLVPCINVILMIVWACSEPNKSKKNWAIASWIVVGIVMIFYFVMFIVARNRFIDFLASFGRMNA